jgi:hypothetical protein
VIVTVLSSVAEKVYHFPFVAGVPFGLVSPHNKVGGVPFSFVNDGAVVVEPIAIVNALSQLA